MRYRTLLLIIYTLWTILSILLSVVDRENVKMGQNSSWMPCSTNSSHQEHLFLPCYTQESENSIFESIHLNAISCGFKCTDVMWYVKVMNLLQILNSQNLVSVILNGHTPQRRCY